MINPSGGDVPSPLGFQERWDFGDGGTGSGPTPDHTYNDDGVFIVRYTVKAFDSAGEFVTGGEAIATATVSNAAPTVTPGTDEFIINEGGGVSAAGASFNDAGSSDTHAAIIYWGDGQGEVGTVDQADTTVSSSSHIYGDNVCDATDGHNCDADGNFIATVTVTDDDLDEGIGALTITVLGLRDLKLGVIADLLPFEGESKRIKKAINEIEKSLDPELWVDEIHMDPKHGNKVSRSGFVIA